eukprot:COSAG02_NODE_2342_length_9101_cov_78.830038_6_plen_96_part_00
MVTQICTRGYLGDLQAIRSKFIQTRAATATQERQRAPDDTLWWQLLREPYPSAPPPCAHVPTSQHAQLSTEPAGGSQLPSLPQQRGAPQRHHRCK